MKDDMTISFHMLESADLKEWAASHQDFTKKMQDYIEKLIDNLFLSPVLPPALSKAYSSANIAVIFAAPPGRLTQSAPRKPIQQEIQTALTQVTAESLQTELSLLLNHEHLWEPDSFGMRFRCRICTKMITLREIRLLSKEEAIHLNLSSISNGHEPYNALSS